MVRAAIELAFNDGPLREAKASRQNKLTILSATDLISHARSSIS
jgi:hypothetical protein